MMGTNHTVLTADDHFPGVTGLARCPTDFLPLTCSKKDNSTRQWPNSNTSLSGVKLGCSSSHMSSSRRNGASSPVNIWPSLLTTGTLESGSVIRSARFSSSLGRLTRCDFLWAYGGVSPSCTMQMSVTELFNATATNYQQNFIYSTTTTTVYGHYARPPIQSTLPVKNWRFWWSKVLLTACLRSQYIQITKTMLEFFSLVLAASPQYWYFRYQHRTWNDTKALF